MTTPWTPEYEMEYWRSQRGNPPYNSVLPADFGLAPASWRDCCDLGCGPYGGILPFLPGSGRRVGVDALADWFRAEGMLAALPAGIEILQGTFDALPFPVEAFDAVFSCNAIDHGGDVAATFKEVARVLRPGGEFYVYVHLRAGQETDVGHQVLMVNDLLAWAEAARMVLQWGRIDLRGRLYGGHLAPWHGLFAAWRRP